MQHGLLDVLHFVSDFRNLVSNAVKLVCMLFRGRMGGGDRKSSILGRVPAQPDPGGAWERPRPGPRSICVDFQPVDQF
jgi:hypothetical protein